MLQQKIKLNQYPLFLCLFFIFTGCKTTGSILQEKYTDPLVLPQEMLCPEEIVWTNIPVEGAAENTFLLTQHKVKEINAEWKCIKIDLDTANLEIEAEPIQASGKRFYLKDFSQKYKTIAAINTVPFAKDKNRYYPVGVVKIQNEIIYPVNKSFSALGLIEKRIDDKTVYRATIINQQNEKEIELCNYAFGGFSIILNDDEIPPFKKLKRSRSACGISDDGRYLYLFAGCGINYPDGRNGFNFEECGIILKSLGCDKAMTFDGGHSTGLTVKNKNAIRPALQRKISAAFGIKISNISN